jgi:hypothetical protein
VRSSARIRDFSPIDRTADKACEPFQDRADPKKNEEQNIGTDNVPITDDGASLDFEELPLVVSSDQGSL